MTGYEYDTACYVCGQGRHAPTGLHSYVSNAEADKHFAGLPDGDIPSMTTAETLDPREAALIKEDV